MRLHASKAAEPRYSPACKLEEEGGATIFVTKYDLRNTKRGHPPSPNLSAFPHFHNAPDLQKHRYKTQIHKDKNSFPIPMKRLLSSRLTTHTGRVRHSFLGSLMGGET